MAREGGTGCLLVFGGYAWRPETAELLGLGESIGFFMVARPKEKVEWVRE